MIIRGRHSRDRIPARLVIVKGNHSMTTEKIEQAIYEYIASHNETSFLEIEHLFESIGYDYHGDKDVRSADRQGVVFWALWKREATEAIVSVVKRPEVKMHATSILTYMVDGGYLNMPLVESKRPYKRLHWQPVVFDLEKETN